MPAPFRVEDLGLYQHIEQLDGVPSLDIVACAIERVDLSADSYSSAIWCFPLDGGEPWQMTQGSARDSYPKWSPDGSRLAFLSDSAGGPDQVYVMARDGGERRQLTHFDKSAISMVWAPDGQSLLVCATVASYPHSTSGEAKPVSDGGPEIVWRLPYKLDGIGYVLNEQIHLFRVDVHSGEVKQLTSGEYEVRGASYSPDGRTIAFCRTREGRCCHRTDIWRMRPDGSHAEQLSFEVASAMAPVWSHDGHAIAFSGSHEDGDAQVCLWSIDCSNGTVRRVGDENLEVVDGEAIVWDRDGNGLCLIAARRGLQEIAHIDVRDGSYRTVAGGERHISALAPAAGGTLVFSAESPRDAIQLYRCQLDGSAHAQLSRLNAWWYERDLPQLSLRQFDVPDGDGGTETVDAWVLRPPGASTAGPVLVDVHGGPASYVLLAYSSHLYWNVLASLGWTVLAINAVGSSSYGRQFAGRLRGRWGDLDLSQHVAAARQLQQTGESDGRLAITGKSYGGYAAAWAIATTDHFRVAVVSAPLTHLETHYGTSDSGYYADSFEMDGKPADNRAGYTGSSPARMATQVRTPMLVLQGKDDQRCPLAQAEDFFVRVMHGTDTPAEMVLYPGGSHHFFERGKPSYRVDAAQRLVNWLQRWIDTPLKDSTESRC